MSNVEESISIATSDVVPILIPPAPWSVNAPLEVVKLEAAPLSIVIAPSASISMSPTPDPLLVAAIVSVFVPPSLAVIVKLVVSVPSRDKAPAAETLNIFVPKLALADNPNTLFPPS